MRQSPVVVRSRDNAGNLHFDLQVGATLVLSPDARRDAMVSDMEGVLAGKLVRMIRAEVLTWEVEDLIFVDRVPR